MSTELLETCRGFR